MSPHRLFLALLMLLCMLPLHALAAQNDLVVRLRSPDSLSARESGRVIVSITNKSSRVLLLPRVKTPLFNPDDHLMNNFMTVLDANGKQAKFIGRFVTLVFEAKHYFYVAIQPGQTLDREIDLAQDYDLRAGGVFRVSYVQDYGETDLYESDDYAPYKSASNELTIFISKALIRTNAKTGAERIRYTPPKCDIEELAAISRAVYNAAWWNYEAWNLLADNIDIEEREEEVEGRPITLVRWGMKATPDYVFWFGEPDRDEGFAEELLGYPDHNRTDFKPLGVVSAVWDALFSTPFHCGCDPAKYDDRQTLAWANQSEGAINYCKAFFSAPPDRPSGQSITVLHEISHLLSDPNLVTSDYAYGRKQAHALSLSNRTQATRNADNYNFYIEAINHVH